MSLLLWHIVSGICYQATPAFWLEYCRAIICSCVYLRFGFTIFYHFLPDKSPKRVAFIPTILSSALVTLLSLPTIIQWISRIYDYGLQDASLWLATSESFLSSSSPSSLSSLLAAPSSLLAAPSSLLAAPSSLLAALFSIPVASFSAAFFLTSLWADSIVSAIYFPGHMEILAGWIHHSLYIALTSAALAYGFTNGLSLLFIEEVPTFILCLGQAVPKLRSEKGFGYTFFATRVCFHSFVTSLLVIYTRNVSNAWISACLAALLHSWWFVGWIQRQYRLKHQKLNAPSKPPMFRRGCSFASTCASPEASPGRRLVIGTLSSPSSSKNNNDTQRRTITNGPNHTTLSPARTTPPLELTVIKRPGHTVIRSDDGREDDRCLPPSSASDVSSAHESTMSSFDCDLLSLGSPVYMRSAGLTRSLLEEEESFLSPKRTPGLLELHERSYSAKQYVQDGPLGSWA